MPGIGSAPGGPMAMEDVGDLQPRAAHRRRAKPPGLGLPSVSGASRSSGLVTAADRGVGDAGVKRGGVELGVAEQHLDDADVGVLLQQVGGEAVPQRVRRHPLLDPGGLGGGVDGAVELAGRERLDRVAAREQPAARQQHAAPPALPPPVAQQFEQLRRQHGVAIFAALAALDPQQHALAVDVADLERDDLGDAQPGAVGGGERRLVLRPRRRLEQKRDLLGAQHGRQPARLRARP